MGAKKPSLDTVWKKLEFREELTLAERKLLHAELARDPSIPAKIDAGLEEVRRAVESGELRRLAPPRRDRGTSKAAS